jgi:hypothetical protein
MLLNAKIWYSQRVGSSIYTLFKENLVPALRACHLANSTTHFCISFNRLGLIEARRQIADFIVSDSTELRG